MEKPNVCRFYLLPHTTTTSYYLGDREPTNKGLRKEIGRLITNKSSVASSSAAAKRDHAVTVPPPPQRKGQTTRQLPLLLHAISDMQVASKMSPPRLKVKMQRV